MGRSLSFFRYPGGKAKVQDIITEVLRKMEDPEKVEYREPFFGGGSIGLKFLSQCYRIKRVWINDKDIGIACLWTAIIRSAEEFEERVKSFQPSVKAFHEFKEMLLDLSVMPTKADEIVDVGFKKMAIHQISYSGLGTKSGGPLGGEKQKSQYKIDCRWSPDYICNKVQMLHKFLSRLSIRDNACTNLDYTKLLTKRGKHILYLDPPYYVKGNDLYQCGFTEQEHVRLAELLKDHGESWVLSYDDCPEIRKLYKWASLYSFDVNYSITALKADEGSRLSRKKAELLICPKHKVVLPKKEAIINPEEWI